MADDVQWVQDFQKAHEGRDPTLADYVARKQFETQGNGGASWWDSYAPDEQTQALQDVPFQTNPGGFTGGTPRPWAAMNPNDAEQMAYWQSLLPDAQGGAKDWLVTNMNQLAQANKGAEHNFPEGARQSFLDINVQPEEGEPAWAARVKNIQSWIDQMMSQGQIGSENPRPEEKPTQGIQNSSQGIQNGAQGTQSGVLNAPQDRQATPPPTNTLAEIQARGNAERYNPKAMEAAIGSPQGAEKSYPSGTLAEIKARADAERYQPKSSLPAIPPASQVLWSAFDPIRQALGSNVEAVNRYANAAPPQTFQTPGQIASSRFSFDDLINFLKAPYASTAY